MIYYVYICVYRSSEIPWMRPLIILQFRIIRIKWNLENDCKIILRQRFQNKTVDPVDLIGHMKYGLIESWQSIQRDLEWKFRLKEKEFDFDGTFFKSYI